MVQCTKLLCFFFHSLEIKASTNETLSRSIVRTHDICVSELWKYVSGSRCETADAFLIAFISITFLTDFHFILWALLLDYREIATGHLTHTHTAWVLCKATFHLPFILNENAIEHFWCELIFVRSRSIPVHSAADTQIVGMHIALEFHSQFQSLMSLHRILSAFPHGS